MRTLFKTILNYAMVIIDWSSLLLVPVYTYLKYVYTVYRGDQRDDT